MPEPGQSTDLAAAVQEVSERMTVLVREEIELAKAEVSAKVTKLAKGAAVGAAAGVFLLGALATLLHALGWLAWKLLPVADDDIWAGFAVVTLVFVLLAALAGFLAYRFVRGGSPPMPTMAIDEAHRIRETVAAAQRSEPGSHT
ncbi:MAG TPA: phage holin family protein [Solirubrobacteraceae bacterium]|nr:phage holin family protein [Solirubrobacteraceae bacterium]